MADETGTSGAIWCGGVGLSRDTLSIFKFRARSIPVRSLGLCSASDVPGSILLGIFVKLTDAGKPNEPAGCISLTRADALPLPDAG